MIAVVSEVIWPENKASISTALRSPFHSPHLCSSFLQSCDTHSRLSNPARVAVSWSCYSAGKAGGDLYPLRSLQQNCVVTAGDTVPDDGEYGLRILHHKFPGIMVKLMYLS